MEDLSHQKDLELLKERIVLLEKENELLRKQHPLATDVLKTVSSPPELKPVFDTAEKLVGAYFKDLKMDPSKASISIGDERYVLMRASSLSIDFFHKIKDLYADKGEIEAFKIGQKFLFDIAHVIGIEDAKNFHEVLDLGDPISKLSAGPVHFAYSGWAYVDILEGSPSPDENYYLKYNHPYSFEAEAWIKKGIKSDKPVCIMNAGYSSGWCEESFNTPLTAVEITCRAKGDEHCTFIMAHPDRIEEHLAHTQTDLDKPLDFDIPLFFERRKAEQEIIKSLKEKTILLQEIHHRVKNNLQIISSLLNLQSHYIQDKKLLEIFESNKNRIKAIALVHEKLNQSQSTDSQNVNLKEYIELLVTLLAESFDFGLGIKIHTDQMQQSIVSIEKAIPCGLIINELVSNSIKHGFTEQNSDQAQIDVTMSEAEGKYKICVKDNGWGLHRDFSLTKVDSLGFEIILSLVEQIHGTVSVETEKGTEFIIEFDYQ